MVGPAPADLRHVRSDAEIRALVVAARTTGAVIPPLGLLGGDLMRAVGGVGDPARFDGEVPTLPVDVVRVEAEPGTSWFVAHAIARRSWWRGELVAAMNVQHLGRWDVAPRAHPNDGRVDVVRVAATMPVRDRVHARGRLPLGTHLPHPDIEVRPSRSAEVRLARPARLWLDGERWGTARELRLTVEPDSLLVCV